MAFESGVNAPGGVSYAAPLMQFQQFANWKADDPYQKVFNQQQQALNEQRIATGQRQAEIAQTFKGGLPVDPKTGAIDYKKAVAMLAEKGDNSALWSGADAVLTQGAANLSPLLMGGAQPAQGAPQGAPQAAPASIPAKPLPPPAANSPQGDPGKGTIASIVTDRLPNQDATTGQTIVKVAQVMGVDPNATLTPGQLRRAQGLVQKYVPAAAAASPAAAVVPIAAQPAGGGTAFKDRFAAAGGEGGNLPPSANAVSPAPKPAPAAAPQPAPIGAPAEPAAAPATLPAAAVPAAHPIKPQTPLPNGFTDPQAAIMALRTEAARMSANPKAAGQVAELRNWAERIEESIKPVSATVNSVYLDPKTGQPIYDGARPTMAPDAIQAAAENYLQSGKLPPNMGRGTQGNADRNAILNAVSELADARGINQAELPQKWQEFRAKGIGKSTAERVKANREENLDIILRATEAAIPAALAASKALPRNDFVPLNKIIQNGQINTSNPKLVEFGMANLQLAEHWARAMNPTGVMRESDREKALSFLSTAYGNDTYAAAVRQLETQIKREKAAVREGKSVVPAGADPIPGADAGKGTTEWVRGPDGKLAPAK